MTLASRKTLSHHFNRALISVVFVVMAVLSLILITLNAFRMDRELEARLNETLKFAHVIVGPAVWHLHNEYLEQCLGSMLHLESVAFVEILDSSGKQLVEKKREKTNYGSFKAFDESYRYMAREIPISYHKKKIGAMRIAVSREDVFRELITGTLWAFLATVFLFIAIFFTNVFVSRRYIIKPLRKLRDAAASIAGGNLDAPVDDSGADEIHSLAADLNTMRQSIKTLIDDLKQANIRLEDYAGSLEQKVDERTLELSRTLKEVEEVNRVIIKSMRYAEKIQASLLPSGKKLADCFDDHFVIWRPCDIVGGDIYMFEESPSGDVIAVFDCTGHGIPGAFMTMIAGTVFRRAVSDFHKDPAEILRILNREVHDALYAKGKESASDDGLDACVCHIDRDAGMITYAGARLPLLHSDDSGLHIVRGDRRSIGYKNADIDFTFANRTIPIKSGMSVYMFTDGLSGQTGGPKSIALGNKRLTAKLAEIRNEPFAGQREEIMRFMREWKGDGEFQDDITMVCIGFSRTKNPGG